MSRQCPLVKLGVLGPEQLAGNKHELAESSGGAGGFCTWIVPPLKLGSRDSWVTELHQKTESEFAESSDEEREGERSLPF